MSSATNDNEQRKKPLDPTTNQNKGRESYLFAFDFDHTIVNDNSDTYITRLVQSPLPPEVESVFDGTNWTEYMNKVFAYLHKEGVTIQEISKCVQRMEPTKGMIPLLKSLVQHKTKSKPGADLSGNNGSSPNIHLLVISDANDLFISDFLKAQVLSEFSSTNLNNSSSTATFQEFPFDIITNKSSVSSGQSSPIFLTANGNNNEGSMDALALSISPFEHQTSCKICPKNLCKGSAILKYMEDKGPFSRVFYTGDGGNDVCPSLKLSQRDNVFVRQNYRMHKKLQKSSNSLGIVAKVVYWDDADTIQTVINEALKLS